ATDLAAFLGLLEEADDLHQRVLDVEQRTKDHRTMNNQAAIPAGEAADAAVRSMEAHLRALKPKHPRTQVAVLMAIAMKMADQKFEEALGIADGALEQARREFGPDDLTTMYYLDLRVGVLCRLGDLERAGMGAAEVLAARERKLQPDDLGMLQALARLADIRRHQGATDQARKLFARLHDAAQRALDSQKQTNPGFHVGSDGMIKWAEV